MKMPRIPNIGGIMKVGKTFVMANRPEILFGASITATLAGVVLAAKGGYEAREVIEKAEDDRHAKAVLEEQEYVPLTTKEKAQLTWQCYMPAAVMTIGALGSTTGLHIVHVKEKKMMAQAALAAIEELKTSAKEFEKETVGVLSNEEKQKILEERAERIPIGPNGDSHIQSSDDTLEPIYLVRDAWSGRDIWSNDHRIEDAVIECNNILNSSDGVDLNFFYNQAGFNILPHGNTVGWSGTLISLEWKETKRDDGRPVREFTFRPSPSKGFDDAHR